jgi:hypothetical protein
MKRLLTTTTAIVVGALCFGAPAKAALTFSDSATFSGLADVTTSGVGWAANVPLNGSVSSLFSLFTLNPGGTCSTSDCSGGPTGTLTDPNIMVNFGSVSSFDGGSIAAFSVGGTYTAKYSGSEVGCAVGDTVSNGKTQTDCFAWTGAKSPTTGLADPNWDGVLTLLEPIIGTKFDLKLTLYNATDWSITPMATAQLVDAPAPEPSTIALLGFGLLGTLAVARRRRA